MRSLLIVASVASALVACGGGDTSRLEPAAPTRSATVSPTATATQLINVDDMMGLYPPQTVFVADADAVSAVRLLNHFAIYRIPTRGIADVATDTTTADSLLYVLDGVEAAAAHVEGATVRLQTFDLQTGAVRAEQMIETGTVASLRRAIGVAPDGRVLLLKLDAHHAWVDAYERQTLKPLGTVMEKAGCGDRLLASPSRIAIVCLAKGEIAIDSLRGAGTVAIAPRTPGLAGVAMAPDGTIYGVTADRQLVSVASGRTSVAWLLWPPYWTGTVVSDGLAVVIGSPSLVVAQLAEDGAWLRVFATDALAPRASMQLAGPLTGAPQGGVQARYPFAYFASGGSVRHVQVDSGMLETMTELGQGATIVAVVDR